MKGKDRDIELNDQHLPLRIAGFVIALIVAIGAIAYGVSGIGRRAPGYYEVEAQPDEALPYYQSGISLQYLFTGSSSEIREEMKRVSAEYTNALKRAYCLLDASETHAGYVNLASLNAAPGQETELDEALFSVLCDALEKTKEQAGYSIYAGPLYEEWNRILYLEDPYGFDPLNNPEEKQRLLRIAEAVRQTPVTLTVTDAARCAVRLDVPDGYLETLEGLELSGSILDLNVLHDAYLLRMVADALEQAGCDRGYLHTESGVTVALSAYEDGSYRLYGLTQEGVTTAGSAKATPGSAGADMRVFPFAEGEYGFYTCGGIRRHPYLTTTDEHAGALSSVMAVSASGKPQDAAYLALRMLAAPSGREAALLAADAGGKAQGGAADAASLYAAWTLPDEQTLYTTPPARFEAAADYRWKLQVTD